MKHHRHAILLTLLLCLVGITKLFALISIYSADSSIILSPDSTGYIETARSILTTGHVSINSENPEIPQIERTPGYPIFLAIMFSVCGVQYPPVLCIQILLSLGTIFLVYKLAAKIVSAKAAILSACLFACDLPSFIHSQKILTDSVFTFVFMLSIFSAINIITSPAPHARKTFVHGGLLAVATLIRPITYYLIFVEVVFFLWLWKPHWKHLLKQSCSALIMLILPSAIIIGGWQFRNYAVAGTFEFSNVVGWNLLFCRGADIIY